MAETIFFIVMLLLLSFWIFYQDRMFRQERQQKDKFVERTMLKFMSETPLEYKLATEELPKDMEDESNPYIDVNEMNDNQVEKVLNKRK